MTDLSLSVDKLRNVGTRNSSRLRRLGIKTLKDLLWHFPARYDDYTETVPISDTVLNQKVNIQGEIVKISTKRLFPRRMFITDAIVKDPSGAVRAVWFNQPFIENQLPEGTFVSLAGKIKTGKRGTYIASPTYERISPSLTSHISHLTSHLKHTKGLVPVYPETEGVTSKYLRFLIKPLLSTIKIVDPTPEEILKKYDFPALTDAVREIHFPSSEEKAKTAKERLAFDDLMLFQAKALLERRKMNQLKSTPISFDEKVIKEFIAQLPFDLTGDQKIALFEIHKDLEKNYPMNRLLEGDVGSGKTVVALSAAYRAARAEFQTVFMAPTEVVANQHFKTATSIITDKNISIGLLTASMSKFNNKDIPKKTLKEKIMSGDVNIVIGTHALIQKDVLFGSLSLVVLDEQHRFGINQRSALIKNKDTVPHLLSMTATPIPRTLALTIYGDLDISIIKEKPKNRQKIVTKIISPTQRKNTYQFIRDEVEAGRQVFVVCPRIELTTNDQQPTTKPNGYQSLHTTVVTPKAGVVEIQIRNEDMHRRAQFGIASHMSYKQLGKGIEKLDKGAQKSKFSSLSFSWVRSLIPSLIKISKKESGGVAGSVVKAPPWLAELAEAHTDIAGSEEFVEGLKEDFFSHRVFVFTPKGDVIDLPFSSTPIDFAYAIHSDLGDHLQGVKVNGKMVSFETPLGNGDVVEIIRRDSAHPSPKWLDIVRTSLARRHIRAVLGLTEPTAPSRRRTRHQKGVDKVRRFKS